MSKSTVRKGQELFELFFIQRTERRLKDSFFIDLPEKFSGKIC